MTKMRVVILVLTLLVVGVVGTGVFFYAKGFRFDAKTFTFTPQGLMVINSDPNGAQVFLDGELETATDATLSLPPGTYDIRVQKEGFLPWEKRLTVEKEIVTKVDAKLFSAGPSLAALTFSGALNPTPSPDVSKIAYGVPVDGDINKAGLWIIESISLPVGFNRDPRQITDGDLSKATWEWSPDGREILLTTEREKFLLNTSEFKTQAELVNVASRVESIYEGWKEKETRQLKAKLARLPDELEEVFLSASSVRLSPDENMILYTATESADLVEGLIKELPGSSTQKQERDIKSGITYVFDIKEDRNFKVAEEGENVYWLPSSAHVLKPASDRVIIMDYDGTNEQVVYSGSYEAPHGYPYANTSQILILTTLGSEDSLPNLYSLNLK